jgi:hypothetical protein
MATDVQPEERMMTARPARKEFEQVGVPAERGSELYAILDVDTGCLYAGRSRYCCRWVRPDDPSGCRWFRTPQGAETALRTELRAWRAEMQIVPLQGTLQAEQR